MNGAQTKSGVVAIVGRPNVGKSTLFNRLCGTWEALVHDEPGLTRDRRYGVAKRIGEGVSAIDTGGLLDSSQIASVITEQTSLAVDESDLTVFLLDAREGITSSDQEIAADLRRRNLAVVPVLNKVDGLHQAQTVALEGEVSSLGFGMPHGISASHNRGVSELAASIAELLPDSERIELDQGVTVAVIGRPNVGKSTLVNAFAGTQRCVVFDQPGTTSDSIEVAIDRGEKRYCLIDTAGIRRRGRIDSSVEKFSVVQALAAMKQAQVSLLLVDASEGVVEQDLHLSSHAARAGSGLVLVVNKWDRPAIEGKRRIRQELERKFHFAPWIPFRFISALRQTGLSGVLREIDRVQATGVFDVSTSELNRVLEKAVADHAPPSVRGRSIKLRFANKVGSFPPAILIHGNQTDSLPESYRRYLENRFRDSFDMRGMPVRLSFRTAKNPFGDRRNRLSARQFSRRQSLIQHRKRRSRRA